MIRVLAFVVSWFLIADSVAAAADPALPGNHPLTQSQAGELLISELRCTSDVYRTFKEGGGLPDGCLRLVGGQPLMGRKRGDAVNAELIPLPVAWVTTWTGNAEHRARVFHVTMGSAQDFQSGGLRRLTVNTAYWCLHLDTEINAESCMDLVGEYDPPDSGFAYDKLNIVPRKPSYYK